MNRLQVQPINPMAIYNSALALAAKCGEVKKCLEFLHSMKLASIPIAHAVLLELMYTHIPPLRNSASHKVLCYY